MQHQAATGVDIGAISAQAYRLGVDMQIDPDNEDFLWLGNIERIAGKPGAGRRALNILCAEADDAEVPIRLAVHQDLAPVIEIYQDLGFKPIPDHMHSRRRDFIVMEREPGLN